MGRFRIWIAALLVTGCGGGGNEVIVLNPGDGRPVEAFYGMDATDVNGDGLADIVAMSTWSDGQDQTERRLNVFVQDASRPGSFRAPVRQVHSESGSLPNIRLVDLRLDGIPAVVAQRGFSSSGFLVYEQDPVTPGTFLDPVVHDGPGVGLFTGFDVADMDGDLYPDVLATDLDENISLHRQLLTSPVTFAAGVPVVNGDRAVRAHDINGDGLNDLVTFQINAREAPLFSGDFEWADTVLVHIQDASRPGQFFTPTEIFFDLPASDLDVADLNNDGRADIVVSAGLQIDNDITHHLLIYRQITPSQFVLIDTLLTGGDIISGTLAIADVDGDGRPEIVAGYRNSAVNPNLVEVFAQNASGNYVSRALITIPDDAALWNPEMLAVRLTDLNDDGLLDIAVSTYELFVIFQDAGTPGTFEGPMRIAGQR